MITLIQRSAAGANLTPGERAILKLLEGLLVAALVAALPIVATALATGSVDWTTVGKTALAAAATAVGLAISKWVKAQTDPPLPVPAPPAS